MKGIHTLDDIKDRCVLTDAKPGCWIWTGYTAGSRPQMRVPELGRAARISIVLHLFLHGSLPPRGWAWHPVVCREHLCCNPAHHRLITKSAINELCRPALTPATRIKISISQRQHRRSKITPEKREQIRQSTLTLKAICAEHGISMAYACVLRSGKVDTIGYRGGSAGLAPGASVFSWGGAAA
ncbi:MAG: hypothetical protein RLZZ524_2608 [Pseudomonadota bacterium]